MESLTNKKMYLDTSALLSLCPKLTTLKEQNAFVSIWTIIELLGHITKDNNDYRKYKSVIRQIIINEFPINQYHPIELFCKAFEVSAPCVCKQIKIHIEDMIRLLFSSDNYIEWQQRCEENGLDDTFQFISATDNATPNFNFFLKRHYPIMSVQEAKQEYINFHANMNHINTYESIVRYYANSMLLKGSLEMTNSSLSDYDKQELLFGLYNGDIDIFLWASAMYVDKKVCYHEPAKRNDDIDLLHLMYINKDVCLVTSDKGLKQLVEKDFPNNVISTTELTQRIS